MRALLVVVVVVSGCGPTGYYVADIRPTAGGLEVTKCAFDDHGKAETGNCTTQTIATAPEKPSQPCAACLSLASIIWKRMRFHLDYRMT